MAKSRTWTVELMVLEPPLDGVLVTLTSWSDDSGTDLLRDQRWTDYNALSREVLTLLDSSFSWFLGTTEAR